MQRKNAEQGERGASKPRIWIAYAFNDQAMQRKNAERGERGERGESKPHVPWPDGGSGSELR